MVTIVACILVIILPLILLQRIQHKRILFRMQEIAIKYDLVFHGIVLHNDAVALLRAYRHRGEEITEVRIPSYQTVFEVPIHD